MVGEIRDEETARVSVQAALTGHLVLATLHTNDAPGTVARLLDMNIEPYLLSGALIGVVAQRLVRTVCKACATRYHPSERVLADAGLGSMTARAFTRGAGCDQCHNSGLRGRLGLYEVMEVNDAIRQMIHRSAPSHEIRATLRTLGWSSLREEGVRLAKEGRTSLEEVLRATHIDSTETQAEAQRSAREAA
jgi:type IV pilus assembly protein PilB